MASWTPTQTCRGALSGGPFPCGWQLPGPWSSLVPAEEARWPGPVWPANPPGPQGLRAPSQEPQLTLLLLPSPV